MDAEDREGLERLQTLAADDDFHAGDIPPVPEMVNMQDILQGSERIELSHAGGEFSLEQDIEDEEAWVDEPGTKARSVGFSAGDSLLGWADCTTLGKGKTGGLAAIELKIETAHSSVKSLR